MNERHLGRLKGLLDKGAGTVATGGTFDDDDRFLAPTITVEPSPDSPIMQEEIFGPILPVLGSRRARGGSCVHQRTGQATRPLRLRRR